MTKGTIAVKGAFSFSAHSLDGKLVETGQGVDAAKFGGSLAAGAYVLKVK